MSETGNDFCPICERYPHEPDCEWAGEVPSNVSREILLTFAGCLTGWYERTAVPVWRETVLPKLSVSTLQCFAKLAEGGPAERLQVEHWILDSLAPCVCLDEDWFTYPEPDGSDHERPAIVLSRALELLDLSEQRCRAPALQTGDRHCTTLRRSALDEIGLVADQIKHVPNPYTEAVA